MTPFANWLRISTSTPSTAEKLKFCTEISCPRENQILLYWCLWGPRDLSTGPKKPHACEKSHGNQSAQEKWIPLRNFIRFAWKKEKERRCLTPYGLVTESGPIRSEHGKWKRNVVKPNPFANGGMSPPLQSPPPPYPLACLFPPPIHLNFSFASQIHMRNYPLSVHLFEMWMPVAKTNTYVYDKKSSFRAPSIWRHTHIHSHTHKRVKTHTYIEGAHNLYKLATPPPPGKEEK